MRGKLMLVGLLVLAATPVRSAVEGPVAVDGLGFPLYARAATYSVFGLNVMYVARGNLPSVVAWYRERRGGAWTQRPVVARGRDRIAELSFTDGVGMHDLRVIGAGGPTVLIAETLTLNPARAFFSHARGLALRGPTDPLGVPLYPHRRRGQTAVLTDAARGLVTYASSDSFDTVFAWFNARLSNRFTLSYRTDGPAGHMRTFHAGNELTVTITRRRQDGDMTVVGVQSAR